MAFKNVARPRFWINTTQWLRTVIDLPFSDELGYHELNPTPKADNMGHIIYRLGALEFEAQEPGNLLKNAFGENSFFALLGHQLDNTNTAELYSGYKKITDESGSEGSTLGSISKTDYINGSMDNRGFSIWTFDGNQVLDNANEWEVKMKNENDIFVNFDLGSAVIGTFYDTPRSPDLNVKMSWDYDGIDTFKSIGGGTFSNARYTGPADFGHDGAWEMEGADRIRTGRRSWDISFSYMTAEEAHPVNSLQSLDAETEVGYGNHVTNNMFHENIFTNTDLYSQVISRCIGSHNPFIFQPDKDNNNPDQFAICRFDQKSFKYDKISDNLYKIQFKIIESW